MEEVSPGLRTAIVVFARLPVPGRVKTRLAAGPGVGPRNACDFYRACAQHAVSQASRCSGWADVFVYHSSADVTADVASWLGSEGLEVPCRTQLGPAGGAQGSANGSVDVGTAAGTTASSGGVPGSAGCGGSSDTVSSSLTASSGASVPEPDLGAKMLAAMSEAQRRRSLVDDRGQQQGKVLIIGTDIPDITAELLRRAADALDEHEMVIGPSLDGGYYLLGLTRLELQLFQGVHWSTSRVLADTLDRAAAAGLRVAPLTWLPRLRDIDTVQDLAEWVASRRGSAPSPQPGAVQSRSEVFPSVSRAVKPTVLSPLGPLDGQPSEDLDPRWRQMFLVSQRVVEQAEAAVAAAIDPGAVSGALKAGAAGLD